MRLHSPAIPVVPAVMILAVTLAALAPAGEAEPRATLQRGRVTGVLDGDTFDVDFNRDGGADARVRVLGIDTPEVGSCGARAAKRALRRLIGGRRVELRSDGNQTGKRDRLLRRVGVRRNGRMVDVTRWMLLRGYGLWMPRSSEMSRALGYHRASAKAAVLGRRMFNPVRCRRGPRQGVGLRMDVQWRGDYAAGVDSLYEEFVRITNTGPAGIDVDGWTIRTGKIRALRIPKGKPIASGRTLAIHTGSGKNRRYHRFLGRSVQWLADVDLDGTDPHVGEGVYVLDRDGDMRAFQMWPCVLECEDPTGGALVIDELQYDPPGGDAENLNGEWVRFVNAGTSSVHTGRLVIEMLPRIVELPPQHRLKPGKTLTIRVGKGTTSHDVRYLGLDRPLMINAGGRVLIRTYDGIIIDCASWGNQACPAGE